MKALILAAGLGTRLRPLTLVRPKPLCLYYGRPLLDLVYSQIRQSGLDHIAINTHHLSDKIEQHLLDHRSVYTQPPFLSYEPIILGTGGCINPLRTWLGDEDLLIYNADIVCDLPIHAVLEQHKQRQPVATMVLITPQRRGTTPVYWDEERGVRAIGGSQPPGTQTATFSGIHIVGPALRAAIPEQGFQSIIDAYQALLQAGARIEARVHPGFWADLGQPEEYLAAHTALLMHQEREKIWQRLGLPSVTWLDEARSALVEQTSSCDLEDSFLFGPIELQGIQSIQQCIVYPGCKLGDQTELRRTILTPDLSLTW